MNIFQAVQESKRRLEQAGIEGENARFLFMGRKNWSLNDWLKFMKDEISKEDLIQLKQDEIKLLQHVPPQYLLGFSEFYGRNFKVTSDTLIPRPETEELVEKVLACGDESLPLNIVDIGTGTGAIGVTISLERPQWKVWAVDISIGAMNVAKENAKALGATVHFDLGDTLQPFIFPIRDVSDMEYFDIIVSNPPYIAESEKDVMDESVKLFEPEIALFAEDEGLAMYKKIAVESTLVLKKTGIILLEIGYKQGEAVKNIFQKVFPNRKIEILKDMAGQERIVYVHSEE